MFKGATLPAVVAGVLATSAIAQDQNSNEALKKQIVGFVAQLRAN